MDTIGPAKVSDKNAKVGPGQTLVIDGKAGVLGVYYMLYNILYSCFIGAHRDSIFLDVACGKGAAAGFTLCVTSKGLICQFNHLRVMDKWVNLKANRVFGCSMFPHLLYSNICLRLQQPSRQQRLLVHVAMESFDSLIRFLSITLLLFINRMLSEKKAQVPVLVVRMMCINTKFSSTIF